MKVGLLAPPWLPVPPPSYGGTEAVIDGLARGLQRAGHDVMLFTTGDSTSSVPIAFALKQCARDRWEDSTIELGHVAAGYEALSGCDVVHDHTHAGPAWGLGLGRRPVVATCHLPLDGELHDVYRAYGQRLPLIAISHSQASSAPDVPITRVIHHGLDLDRFPLGGGDGGYLLFLGRMAADKGVREAVIVAREAGLPLKLAAKMGHSDERAYFTEQVAPLLGGNIEYVGEVGGSHKLELIGAARALLSPISWPEPFGLVMIEALACGTPVVVCPVGAAPEIVDHGLTGFLCPDHDALVVAVSKVGELDRAACRDAVAGRFSTERMVADHVELYEEVMLR